LFHFLLSLLTRNDRHPFGFLLLGFLLSRRVGVADHCGGRVDFGLEEVVLVRELLQFAQVLSLLLEEVGLALLEI
jgi:hypothetical protein